jgi:hypothetical protein
VEEAFRDSVLDREGWIAAPAVLESLDRATRRGEASDHFWYLFVLESWLRRERPEAVTIPSTIHPSVAYRPL